MFFKTLVFLFILYLLVKAIRRFFLPGGNKKSNARFFYQAYRNIQKQQKQQQKSQNNNGNNKFDEIEEADFEEIEEDDSKTSD